MGNKGLRKLITKQRNYAKKFFVHLNGSNLLVNNFVKIDTVLFVTLATVKSLIQLLTYLDITPALKIISRFSPDFNM